MIIALALACITRVHFIKNTHDKGSRVISILWIACFSLLKTSLSYFFLMIYSISLILATLNKKDDEKVHPFRFIKVDLSRSYEILISFVLILILFIFFPRYRGFFPKRSSTKMGQIGYSQTIDNSIPVNLQLSSQIVFTAKMEKKLQQHQLYWRGRVHQKTDGFNWNSSVQLPGKTQVVTKGLVEYTIKLEKNLNRDIILLESPYKITSSNLNYNKDNFENQYNLYQDRSSLTYTARSSLESSFATQTKNNWKQLTALPKFIPSSLKKILTRLDLKGQSLDHVLDQLKSYMLKNKFSYSLNPGDVTTLKKFITKKVGYCTHYASFIGISLRLLGFPTRLVSGFQGGSYNELGRFYTVYSNDAHAWVEVLHEKKWIRVDPTGFIDPRRINLGGQAYLTNDIKNSNPKKASSFFSTIKMYTSFINYKLSLFLDNYDREKQKKIFIDFKLNKKIFYLIGIFLFILFLLSTLLVPNKRKKAKSKVDFIFHRFTLKFRAIGYNIDETQSLDEIKSKLFKYPAALEFIDLYEKISYKKSYTETELKRYKELYRSKNTYKI